MIDKPGIYTMSMEEYQADPCPAPSLSSSIAHLLCSSSPLHAWSEHPRLNPSRVEEEKEHFDIGTIAHALILEGESKAEVLDFPDWRTNKAKDARDAARKEKRIPILRKYWDDVLLMVNAARVQLDAHRGARDAFTNGRPEQTLIWREAEIWCRARPDWLHDSMTKIDDYKTTGVTANPEVVSRTLFSNGYDVQAAFYLRGLKALTGKDAQFRFVYQETHVPHALSVVSLGPDSQMIGEKKVLYAMEKFGDCLSSGIWPGYPNQICYATLPAYEEARWLEKELNHVV